MPINNHLRNIKMHSSAFAAIVSLVFTKKFWPLSGLNHITKKSTLPSMNILVSHQIELKRDQF